MRRFRTTIVLALAALLFVSISSAQQTATTSVPNLIRYSGTLKDAQAAALSSSTAVGVTFSIYKQQDGGPAVWMETQNVTPDANGQYNVILGSTVATGLPDDLFSQQEQRWLGVQIQGQTEQARVLLVSVPYAFKAHEAETLGGLPASAFVKAPSGAPSDGSNGTALNALGNSEAQASLSKGKSGASGKAPCNGGTGTANVIPVWDTLGCDFAPSLMSQPPALGRIDDSENFNLSNSAMAYQIGGNNVLSIGPVIGNLFVGVGAGSGGGTGHDNTFTGAGAGFKNNTGSFNTYNGFDAGRFGNGDANTFTGTAAGLRNLGSNNVFTGYQAGFSGPPTGITIQASNNTFSGYAAGSNNQADGNSFYGYQSGLGNTTGAQNTFIGLSTGSRNTTGGGNTFVGYSAGLNSNGCCGTLVGVNAGLNSMAGGTFFGYRAGESNTTGGGLFAGYEAGFRNTTGVSNTFIGDVAGYYNTTGQFNTFVGTGAGSGGDNNVAIGYSAGRSVDLTGSGNIEIGNSGSSADNNIIRIGNVYDAYSPKQTDTYIAGIYNANTNSGSAVFVDPSGKLGTLGGNIKNSNVCAKKNYQIDTGCDIVLSIDNSANPADGNLFVGVSAGSSNSSGDNNTFIGYSAGAAHIDGQGNTYVGTSAGQKDTRSPGTGQDFHGNSFIGFQAGYSNDLSDNNTFLGWEAGFHNAPKGMPGANDNTFIGDWAGTNNVTGYSNTFLGSSAGLSNGVGAANTYLGAQAGYSINQGTANIMVGSAAGLDTVFGNNNIYIGSYGCYFIGGFQCSEFGAIRIGNPPGAAVSQSAAFIAGIYGHGTTKGGGGRAVYISSDGKLGTYSADSPSIGEKSSRRFKENILDMGEASSKLFQLRPVTFFYKPQYDDGSHTMQDGLIAEEVAKVYPELVGYDKDGRPPR